MASKRLWILIEGNDEKRFFERIKRFFEEKYDFVQTWKYAQEPTKRVENFLNSIERMSSDYFFLKDINDSPCVTDIKEKIGKKYRRRIKPERIIIVIKEIESWYLAGLDKKSLKEIGTKTLNNTDEMTKEQFNSLMPKKYDYRIDFMAEVLKRFSIETAKRKNKSFDYFIKKIQAV